MEEERMDDRVEEDVGEEIGQCGHKLSRAQVAPGMCHHHVHTTNADCPVCLLCGLLADYELHSTKVDNRAFFKFILTDMLGFGKDRVDLFLQLYLHLCTDCFNESVGAVEVHNDIFYLSSRLSLYRQILVQKYVERYNSYCQRKEEAADDEEPVLLQIPEPQDGAMSSLKVVTSVEPSSNLDVITSHEFLQHLESAGFQVFESEGREGDGPLTDAVSPSANIDHEEEISDETSEHTLQESPADTSHQTSEGTLEQMSADTYERTLEGTLEETSGETLEGAPKETLEEGAEEAAQLAVPNEEDVGEESESVDYNQARLSSPIPSFGDLVPGDGKNDAYLVAFPDGHYGLAFEGTEQAALAYALGGEYENEKANILLPLTVGGGDLLLFTMQHSNMDSAQQAGYFIYAEPQNQDLFVQPPSQSGDTSEAQDEQTDPALAIGGASDPGEEQEEGPIWEGEECAEEQLVSSPHSTLATDTADQSEQRSEREAEQILAEARNTPSPTNSIIEATDNIVEMAMQLALNSENTPPAHFDEMGCTATFCPDNADAVDESNSAEHVGQELDESPSDVAPSGEQDELVESSMEEAPPDTQLKEQHNEQPSTEECIAGSRGMCPSPTSPPTTPSSEEPTDERRTEEAVHAPGLLEQNVPLATSAEGEPSGDAATVPPSEAPAEEGRWETEGSQAPATPPPCTQHTAKASGDGGGGHERVEGPLCPLCPTMCTCDTRLKKHHFAYPQGTVHEEWSCDRCVYTTRYLCEKLSHLSKHQVDGNMECLAADRVLCKVCDVVMDSSSRVIRHMNFEHIFILVDHLYRCVHCGGQSFSLERVQLTDSTIPLTYPCILCKRRFVNMKKWTSHMRIHEHLSERARIAREGGPHDVLDPSLTSEQLLTKHNAMVSRVSADAMRHQKQKHRQRLEEEESRRGPSKRRRTSARCKKWRPQ